jgi:hypothetical protein
MVRQAFARLFNATNVYDLDTPQNFVAVAQDAVTVVKANTPSTSVRPTKPPILAASSAIFLTLPPTVNAKNGTFNGISRKSWLPKIFHSTKLSTSKSKIR